MIKPDAQGAEATLAELSPIMPTIYRTIEGAVQQGLEFFGDDPVDATLLPNLVRYYAKETLGAAGLRVVDDGEPVLAHRILPNNGLYLEYGERRIRILKADHGGLPAPGLSHAKQQFYEQLSLLEEPMATQNLVLLWDVVAGVVELQLVCPRWGSERATSVHWAIPVPHPAATIASAETEDEPFEFDVPIDLPRGATADDE
jgi:hypothetical protein